MKTERVENFSVQFTHINWHDLCWGKFKSVLLNHRSVNRWCRSDRLRFSCCILLKSPDPPPGVAMTPGLSLSCWVNWGDGQSLRVQPDSVSAALICCEMFFFQYRPTLNVHFISDRDSSVFISHSSHLVCHQLLKSTTLCFLSQASGVFLCLWQRWFMRDWCLCVLLKYFHLFQLLLYTSIFLHFGVKYCTFHSAIFIW